MEQAAEGMVEHGASANPAAPAGSLPPGHTAWHTAGQPVEQAQAAKAATAQPLNRRTGGEDRPLQSVAALEKKKQKTFMSSRRRWKTVRDSYPNVFWFFFSKKNIFLSAYD